MLELSAQYNGIKNKLDSIVNVTPYEIDIDFEFSIAFARIFWNDTPHYQLKDGNFGATRSNWTYHTAFALAQTCKMFDLICKFECEGRRDAVIQTNEDIPKVILHAEWEWDYEDIFGKGKELEKLKNSCKNCKTSNAFLLTYRSNQKYPDYLFRITDYWVKFFKNAKNPPSLFLHVVTFEDKKFIRDFESLKTVIIDPTNVFVLSDIS